MDFKDKWRGMQVPNAYRPAFFRWDNSAQQEVELEAPDVLNILGLTPEADRGTDWHAAERAVLDAPLHCKTHEPSGIPNCHGFPHWDDLHPHQQAKANQLSLSEKDFRDYDPAVQARSGKEWEYAQPVELMNDVLYHQSQRTAVGRFLAWASRIEGFWVGVLGGMILVVIFCWIWDAICPVAPSSEAAARMALVNPYYYSSQIEHFIGQFWGSVIVFVMGFSVVMGVYHGSTREECVL